MKRVKTMWTVIIVIVLLLVAIPAAGAEDISIPILMYHNIIEGNGRGDNLNVSEQRFEEQIRQLKYYGYNTIDFEEMYDYFKGEGTLPPNPVIITFDDGYVSNYTYAYPILKKYGFKATVFMVADYIDKEGYLKTGMLQEMQSVGTFDVQSHSVNHLYRLSSADSEEMAYEVGVSKRVLEELLEKPVKVFCYPYGRSSKKLRDVLEKEGYTLAVTTRYGVASKYSNFLKLNRLRVLGYDSGKSLRSRIEKNTRNRTYPLFEDVDADDTHLLIFIDGVKKGWMEVRDGKIYPGENADFQGLIKGLSDIADRQITVKKETHEEVTVQTALQVTADNFYIPGFTVGRDLLKFSREKGLLEGIQEVESHMYINRREMLVLLNNLNRVTEQARKYYRDMPVGSIATVGEGTELFITGNYYTEESEAPDDVFALDIDKDTLRRITYFNDRDYYNIDVEKIYASPDGKKLLVEITELDQNRKSVQFIDLVKAEAVQVREIVLSETVQNICWLGDEEFALHIEDNERERISIYDISINLLDEKILTTRAAN